MLIAGRLEQAWKGLLWEDQHEGRETIIQGLMELDRSSHHDRHVH